MNPEKKDIAPALYYLGAVELARRIALGEVSSRTVLEIFLARIERYNPLVNAIVVLQADDARQHADEADKAWAGGAPLGPLHGVPVTIKECFDWTGTPSTFGYPERAHHRAQNDAEVVVRLKRAGAIVIGKTNVPKDLADWQSFNALYGRTCNPWNHGRSPGGSSGGAAAALAAGFCAMEIGSDIGGSIRVPSHFCGVYGHKPTYGIVPMTGHAMSVGEAPPDICVIGPLARTAEDLALALSLIAGPDGPSARAWSLSMPRPLATSLRGQRIAVITDDPEFPIGEETQRAIREVAAVLGRKGAELVFEPGLPISSRDYYELFITLLRAATSASSSRYSEAEIAALATSLDTQASAKRDYAYLQARGLTQSHRQWHSAQEKRHRLRAEWERYFTHYDALIVPVSPTPAFAHITDVPKSEQRLNVDGESRPMTDTYFWLGIAAVAYLPATTIPAGQSVDGLPIGLQIIGPEFSDLNCIAIAQALEHAHRGFRPPPGYT